MNFFAFVFVMIIPLISMGIHKLYLTEVDPIDFACQHQKQIKGDPRSLFTFVMTPLGMEKLFPWLSRFKEADARIVGPGKSYRAYVKYPILGENRIYITLTEYKPSKHLVLEFDDITKLIAIIQTNSFHDRTLLRISVYCRYRSLLYQYTIGYAMRWLVNDHLERSMKNFATLYENLDTSYRIPNLSKSF